MADIINRHVEVAGFEIREDDDDTTWSGSSHHSAHSMTPAHTWSVSHRPRLIKRSVNAAPVLRCWNSTPPTECRSAVP